jgi:hypothetical protein
MPRGDGTGPRGEGPGTGRGLGRKSGWGRKSGKDLSLFLDNHKELGQIMVCRECWGKLYEENRMMLDTSSYRGESEGRGMGRGLGFGRGR